MNNFQRGLVIFIVGGLLLIVGIVKEARAEQLFGVPDFKTGIDFTPAGRYLIIEFPNKKVFRFKLLGKPKRVKTTSVISIDGYKVYLPVLMGGGKDEPGYLVEFHIFLHPEDYWDFGKGGWTKVVNKTFHESYKYTGPVVHYRYE